YPFIFGRIDHSGHGITVLQPRCEDELVAQHRVQDRIAAFLCCFGGSSQDCSRWGSEHAPRGWWIIGYSNRQPGCPSSAELRPQCLSSSRRKGQIEKAFWALPSSFLTRYRHRPALRLTDWLSLSCHRQ